MDDIQSIAHDSFMYAYQNWDRSRGSFDTLVGCRFRSKTLDHHRKVATNKRRMLPIDENMIAGPFLPDDRWDQIRGEMTEDAQTVARLALWPTAPIVDEFLSKGGSLRNMRTAIRTALREIGWTRPRIRQAFSDLIEAIEA